jgi:hypothetical protein
VLKGSDAPPAHPMAGGVLFLVKFDGWIVLSNGIKAMPELSRFSPTQKLNRGCLGGHGKAAHLNTQSFIFGDWPSKNRVDAIAVSFSGNTLDKLAGQSNNVSSILPTRRPKFFR